MFTTRRFRALNGAKGKYARIVEKIAIYDDNGNQIDCCTIQVDENGREYYHPTNPNHKFGLFTNRPKDAIECIRNDLGDALQVTSMLGIKFEKVVRFIDREIGEKFRQETLAGWADTKFGYGLKYRYLDAISDGQMVCTDKTLLGWLDERQEILSFDTEEKAAAAIKDIEDTAKRYYDEYTNLERTGDKKYDSDNIVTPFFDRMAAELEGGTNSVCWRIFGALDEQKYNERKYKLEIIQVVIQ